VFYLPTSRKFSLLSTAEWKISGAAVLKCWIDTVSGYKVEVGARKVPPQLEWSMERGKLLWK